MGMSRLPLFMYAMMRAVVQMKKTKGIFTYAEIVYVR
jgi:hypothetical protein